MTDATPLRPGALVCIRDQRWRVLTSRTACLEVQGADAANRGHRARFLPDIEACELLPTEGPPRVVRAARWRRHVRQVLADAVPGWTSLRCAERADITLLPFQLEPALA